MYSLVATTAKVIDDSEPVVPACSSDGMEGALLYFRGTGEPVAAVPDDYASGWPARLRSGSKDRDTDGPREILHHHGCDVAVHVESECWAVVTQNLGHHLHRNVGFERQGCPRMAQVV